MSAKVEILKEKTTPAVGHPSMEPPTKSNDFAGPGGGELAAFPLRTKFSSCGGVPAGGGGLVSKSVVSFNLPYNKNLIVRAKELRKSHSLPEALLWREIKSKKINGLDFDRQKVIGNYIVDFFCVKIKTVIEIDDKTHELKEQHDATRQKYLQNLGLRIIHISAKDVLKNPSSVAELLKNILQETQ